MDRRGGTATRSAGRAFYIEWIEHLPAHRIVAPAGKSAHRRLAEKVGDDIQLSLGFHLRFLRKPIFSIAATSARCLAGACANELRIQWTQQR